MAENSSREQSRAGRLAGRNAIVTGGSRGIGAAICLAFAREGAHVAFCHKGDAENAQSTAERIRTLGRRCHFDEADLSDAAACGAFAEASTAALGEIDILVNNAAISISHRFEEISVPEYEAILGVNLRAPFFMAQAVYGAMKARGQGRIINISSQLATKGAVELAHYCAAKAGVLGLTRALAMEGAPFGVLVNAIAPGPVETPMLHVLSEEWRARKRAELPIGRFGQPDEIAPAAVFLASDDGRFMVGATLHVNGGDVMP